MSDDLCSICLNNLDDEQTYTLEACGHQFHTKCIINWFRNSSTCPCCRNNTYEAANNIPGYILRERYKELRKISRRSNAPDELKKLVNRLKNIEIKQKEKNNQLREFRKENKEILNREGKLRRERYNLNLKERQMQKLIGLYNSSDYPLPNLIIMQDFYHYE